MLLCLGIIGWHGELHSMGPSKTYDVSLKESALLDDFYSVLFWVDNDSGITGNELSEKAFIPETTSLLIAAIDLIWIVCHLFKSRKLTCVIKLSENLYVYLKVIIVVHVLNILQSEKLFMEKFINHILPKIMGDSQFIVV